MKKGRGRPSLTDRLPNELAGTRGNYINSSEGSKFPICRARERASAASPAGGGGALQHESFHPSAPFFPLGLGVSKGGRRRSSLGEDRINPRKWMVSPPPHPPCLDCISFPSGRGILAAAARRSALGHLRSAGAASPSGAGRLCSPERRAAEDGSLASLGLDVGLGAAPAGKGPGRRQGAWLQRWWGVRPSRRESRRG